MKNFPLLVVLVINIHVATASYDANYNAAFGWWLFSVAVVIAEDAQRQTDQVLKLAKEGFDGWEAANKKHHAFVNEVEKRMAALSK